MTRWMLRAYAKINLGLRVLSKRADGYHELDTYFLQVHWADQLYFERTRAAHLEFTCNWPQLGPPGENLCTRAYELLCRQTGQRPGLKLHLHKAIPAGGGLGGGSSDAAITMLAVNRLCQLGLTKNDLHALAHNLGSDIAFFLQGGLCRGRGRGVILTPLSKLPQIWVLIIASNLSVSTASVYKNIKLGLTKSCWNSTFALSKRELFENCNAETIGNNDLEDIVFQWHPKLSAVKDSLQQRGALLANMTGSGSAIFGLFDNLQQALQAQHAFRSEYRTFIARPIKWGYDDVDSFLS